MAFKNICRSAIPCQPGQRERILALRNNSFLGKPLSSNANVHLLEYFSIHLGLDFTSIKSYPNVETFCNYGVTMCRYLKLSEIIVRYKNIEIHPINLDCF